MRIHEKKRMSALDTPSSEVIGADPDLPPPISAHELIEALTHLLDLLVKELSELPRYTQSIVEALKRDG